MIETLLGFQLRTHPERQNQWDNSRKAYYLINESIKLCLSVDKEVWPYCQNHSEYSRVFSDYSTEPYSAPNAIDMYNIDDISILDNPYRFNNCILIGVTIVNIDLRANDEFKSRHLISNMSCTLDQLCSWKCLGYDVADFWLLSGLMNCEYDQYEKRDLSKKFTHDINEFGLFKSIETAQDFCAACNLRVPEHSPFGVYGIWSKWEPGRS